MKTIELTDTEIKELIRCIELVHSEWGSLDYELYLKLIQLIGHKDLYS